MAKSEKKHKAKELIKIKFKQLANGNQSIFLEKYEGYKTTSTGNISAKRSFEFLNLYLIPETTAAEKKANATTMQLANAIKAKRIVEQQEKDTSLTVRKNTKVNLIEYVNEIADKAFADSQKKRSDYYTFKSLAHHLKAYKGDSLNVNDIDKDYINGFIDYLKTAKNANYLKATKNAKTQKVTIAKNTAHKLYAKFSTVIKRALQDEIINTNPLQKIDDNTKPKTIPSKREYLDIDEIKTLIKTDCHRPEIKNAFLFCCLVGIRFENVRNITFSDLKTNSKGETVLSYKQIKVDTFETLPVSNEALKFVPSRNGSLSTDTIFKLPKNETVNLTLKKWTTTAEIDKKITFHCSRHTAATLQLSLGTPIETVSKLLGHGKIATTQIYAKIINKNKVDAVDKQNGIFD